MLAALIISASLLAADPAAAEQLTVADVIKALVLDEAKFNYSDEPPGRPALALHRGTSFQWLKNCLSLWDSV